jgi:hypothetical protein
VACGRCRKAAGALFLDALFLIEDLVVMRTSSELMAGSEEKSLSEVNFRR